MMPGTNQTMRIVLRKDVLKMLKKYIDQITSTLTPNTCKIRKIDEKAKK